MTPEVQVERSMADRSNHYEAAFEGFLRTLKVSCLPIDETRRTFTSGEAVKSLDFIVMRPSGKALLIDVKGRSLRGDKPSMENWIRGDDADSLRRWRNAFGGAAVGLLVFVYRLRNETQRAAFADLFEYADQLYACKAIDVEDYAALMKPRSTQWGTFSIPRELFRESCRPFTQWLE
jgi:hypothetical protein